MRPHPMPGSQLEAPPQPVTRRPSESPPSVAESALLPRYPGLPVTFVPQIHEILREHADLKPARMKNALLDPLTSIYTWAGTPSKWVRPLAEASIHMELRALSTARLRDHYIDEEHLRRRTYHYMLQANDDPRTTKMTHWIIAQIPSVGLPLTELETVLDEAVALARAGAFTSRGEYQTLPGAPMVLPEWFQRRSWQTHWIDPRYPLFHVTDDAMVVRLV